MNLGHLSAAITCAFVLAIVPGCGSLPYYSYVNVKSDPDKATSSNRSERDQSSERKWCAVDGTEKKCRNEDENVVGLALSGGGSRAAIFAAQVMFELQNYGVMQRVDVISSVSGGSIAAALYGVSVDSPPMPTNPNASRLIWQPRSADEEAVFRRLNTNFQGRAIARWFWPDVFFKYWGTHYDRSDIMAEIFAETLFDAGPGKPLGLRMQDLNPNRPDLVLNATNTGRPRSLPDFAPWLPLDGAVNSTCAPPWDADVISNALNFTFTRQQFRCLESDFDKYPLAYAVAASAAFPGLLPYVTLRDFTSEEDKPRYVHVFDGGASDNLGLTGLRPVLKDLSKDAAVTQRVLILQVSATQGIVGAAADDPDPRSTFDFIIDKNAFKALDTLMFAGYDRSERQMDSLIYEMVTEARNRREETLNVKGPKVSPTEYLGHREKIALTKVYCDKPEKDPKNGQWKDRGLGAAYEVCEEKQGLEYWKKVRDVGTNFNVDNSQANCVRAAARLSTYMSMTKMCADTATRGPFGAILNCDKLPEAKDFTPEAKEAVCLSR